MSTNFDLGPAEALKVQVTKKQEKTIRKLYREAAKEAEAGANKVAQVPSDFLKQKYLKDLQKELEGLAKQYAIDIKNISEGNMEAVAAAVVQSNIDFLQSVGMPIQGAFSKVPNDVVRSIVSGKIYDGKWSLSSALWKDIKNTQGDIQYIVAQGIASQKSAFDIAKDLEKYVDPSAKKDWAWSKVYPGTKKVVDYNAQRLARTMVSHAYQQSFIRVTKKNPFVTKYKWLSSGGERMCSICEARNGQYFEKDELPLDHPNGMCTFIAVIEDDPEAIADRLADWALGENDPELDVWMADMLGKDVSPTFNATQEKWLSPLGYSPDKMPSTFKEFITKLDGDQKDQILKLAGANWSSPHPYQAMEKWYNANLKVVRPGVTSKAKKVVKTTKKEALLKSSSVPDIGTWIDSLKLNTVDDMLEWEARTLQKLPPEQIQGLRVYTGGSFQDINTFYRNVGKGMDLTKALSRIDSDDLEAAKLAQEGLSSLRIEKSMFLRRGTSLGDLAGLMPGDYRDNKNILRNLTPTEMNDKLQGVVGTFHGFTSTSSIWDKGFMGDLEIIFFAPEGTQASSIMSISQYGTREGETLLNAGTKVKVLKIEESDGHKGSRVRAFLEIIPDK